MGALPAVAPPPLSMDPAEACSLLAQIAEDIRAAAICQASLSAAEAAIRHLQAGEIGAGADALVRAVRALAEIGEAHQ